MNITNSQKKQLWSLCSGEQDIQKQYDDGSVLIRKFLSKIGYVIGKRGKIKTVYYKNNTSSEVIAIRN